MISENDCLIIDPQSVAEIMNNHFVSIGHIKDSAHQQLNDHSTTAEIISYFKEHSCISKISNCMSKDLTFSFEPIP